MKKDWGPPLYRRGGEVYDTCPCADHDETTREALQLWNWAQMGYLPYAGGVYDQPERLLEMIEVVEQVRQEIDAKTTKK